MWHRPTINNQFFKPSLGLLGYLSCSIAHCHSLLWNPVASKKTSQHRAKVLFWNTLQWNALAFDPLYVHSQMLLFIAEHRTWNNQEIQVHWPGRLCYIGQGIVSTASSNVGSPQLPLCFQREVVSSPPRSHSRTESLCSWLDHWFDAPGLRLFMFPHC